MLSEGMREKLALSWRCHNLKRLNAGNGEEINTKEHSQSGIVMIGHRFLQTLPLGGCVVDTLHLNRKTVTISCN